MDINDRGLVLGWHSPGLGVAVGKEAFVYSDGQMREVGGLGGDSTVPQRLNELGQVVGFSPWRGRRRANCMRFSTATTTAGRLT